MIKNLLVKKIFFRKTITVIFRLESDRQYENYLKKFLENTKAGFLFSVLDWVLLGKFC